MLAYGLGRKKFTNYFAYIKIQLRHPDVEIHVDESWIDHFHRLVGHEAAGSREGLRYDVADTLLNAADYGTPQKRERVFIVGFRSDLATTWSCPRRTHSQGALAYAQRPCGEYWEENHVPEGERIYPVVRPSDPDVNDRPWVTLREAVSDLPDPERESTSASNHWDHQFNRGARSYPGHTGSPLDQPAKALKAGVHGVPGGENMLRRPDGSVRYFTVRESARLQTFPDEFVFRHSWSRTMRQLGNAVPVRLAKAVADDVMASLVRR